MMMTVLLAALVVVMIMWGVRAGLLTPFFALLGIIAVLAAFDFVPPSPSIWDSVVFVFLAALWSEGGQIASRSSAARCVALSPVGGLVAAGGGLLVWALAWYGAAIPVSSALAMSFGSIVLVAFIRGAGFVPSVLFSFTVVERGAVGVVVKLVMCGLLVVSLTM